MLRRLNSEGMTIFLTTHYLEAGGVALPSTSGSSKEASWLRSSRQTAKLVARRNDTVLSVTIDRAR